MNAMPFMRSYVIANPQDSFCLVEHKKEQGKIEIFNLFITKKKQKKDLRCRAHLVSFGLIWPFAYSNLMKLKLKMKLMMFMFLLVS